mmetsp:Transcript_47061/g.100734  ORF Transcript_47061/g.100734 Transcript_47061/m.100734 type:complete len:222 (-) Transcript_47061:995-1660(-)
MRRTMAGASASPPLPCAPGTLEPELLTALTRCTGATAADGFSSSCGASSGMGGRLSVTLASSLSLSRTLIQPSCGPSPVSLWNFRRPPSSSNFFTKAPVDKRPGNSGDVICSPCRTLMPPASPPPTISQTSPHTYIQYIHFFFFSSSAIVFPIFVRQSFAVSRSPTIQSRSLAPFAPSPARRASKRRAPLSPSPAPTTERSREPVPVPVRRKKGLRPQITR